MRISVIYLPKKCRILTKRKSYAKSGQKPDVEHVGKIVVLATIVLNRNAHRLQNPPDKMR
jgi:hypothetical protein